MHTFICSILSLACAHTHFSILFGLRLSENILTFLDEYFLKTFCYNKIMLEKYIVPKHTAR